MDVGLASSKTFDGMHWPALWAALLEQNFSAHCIWSLQHIYDGENGGPACGESGRNTLLEDGWSLSGSGSCQVVDGGCDLLAPSAPDFYCHFADDILVFANSGPEAAQLFDELIAEIARAGLIFIAGTRRILTHQAQSPATLSVRDSVVVRALDRHGRQIWLGCM